jgi:hypothetical protein
MLRKQLRFNDLRERGIVKNRVTLTNWIKKRGFPPGRRIGPNSRAWDEGEVQVWVDSRPTDPKPAPIAKRPRGRPRTPSRINRGPEKKAARCAGGPESG